MKRIASAIFVCTALLAGSAPLLKYQLHPKQERVIKIGNKPEIRLTESGRPLFELVIEENPTPTATYAANEMAEILTKSIGSKITVRKKWSGQAPAIIVGDREYARKAGLDLQKLDRDGFYIKTHGGNVIIIGRDDPARRPAYGSGDQGEHATLFAAYDFLERFAGVRFFFPGELGTVIPNRKDWSIPAIDIAERPDFQQRNLYYTCTSKKHREVYRPEEYGNDQLRDRTHVRYQTWNWPCSHGLGTLGYPERFAKTNPEYFAQRADGKTTLGQRKEAAYCYSSGIKQEIIKDAISFLKGEEASVRGVRPRHAPDKFAWPRSLDQKIPVFDITPDDSYVPCQCSECSKHFTGDVENQENLRRISDFMWRFFADVANAVKASGVNGYVAAWSYWPTIFEPPFELPDNILLVVCSRGPWNYRNKTAWNQEMERIAAWGKRSGSKIRLWNYWIKTPFGCLYDIPVMAPHAVEAYYRQAAPHICGVFAETEMERLAYQYLNHYVFYKLIWNMDTDVEALLDEHYSMLFGGAAGTMKAIFTELENTWLSITGNAVETSAGPKTVIPSDYDLWNTFYPEEKIKRINEMFDKAEKEAGPGIELTRVKFMRNEQWKPTVDARDVWFRNSDLNGSWQGYAAKGTPKVLDGSMSDKAWKNAKEMWLCAPAMGHDAFNHQNQVETTVKVLYDENNFYIGFNCHEPLTAKLLAAPQPPASRGYWANASLQIFMNPSGDRKGFYQASVDKNGVVTTLKWKNGVTVPWENGIKVKNCIEEGKYWRAEFIVPRKDMEAAIDSFPANFMRYRAFVTPGAQVYYWYPFLGSTPLAPDKWPKLHLTKEKKSSILKYGDFEKPVDKNGRIGPWYGRNLQRDTNVYLTGGGSIKLNAESTNLKQNFPLKPDTTYEISYFIKLDKLGEKKNGGLSVRFDEFGGNVTMFPGKGAQMRGTHGWTRYRYYVHTSEKCGANSKPGYSSQPYLNFMMTKDIDGTAWVDHVEIREIKKEN